MITLLILDDNVQIVHVLERPCMRYGNRAGRGEGINKMDGTGNLEGRGKKECPKVLAVETNKNIRKAMDAFHRFLCD